VFQPSVERKFRNYRRVKRIGRLVHLCVTNQFVSKCLIVYFEVTEKAKQGVADKYMIQHLGAAVMNDGEAPVL
jgi:hypothetical protein